MHVRSPPQGSPLETSFSTVPSTTALWTKMSGGEEGGWKNAASEPLAFVERTDMTVTDAPVGSGVRQRHRPRVLIVDDEPTSASDLDLQLSTEGFDVLVAHSGRQALELVRDSAPDVIVTELAMPDMDGFALLEQVSAQRGDVPVILVTAARDALPIRAAIRAGAAECFVKPLDIDRLRFAIERALRTRNLCREAAALRAHNEALAAETERNLHAREELLSIVAHDLRGPLSTILLAAQSRDMADASDAGKSLEIVERCAKRMKKLVADLLDVARVEMGGLALELASHRASALLHEVGSSLEALAVEAGVRLELSIRDDFELSCAFDRIVQMIANVAVNAIHVSARGKRVRLVAEQHGEHATFRVEDEGPGIAPALVPYIFERGYHLDPGIHQGAGLGLAIAKGIVEAHGGTVHVDSILGAGCVFRLEMPLHGPARSSWRVSSLLSTVA